MPRCTASSRSLDVVSRCNSLLISPRLFLLVIHALGLEYIGGSPAGVCSRSAKSYRRRNAACSSSTD
nr:MAG TPA: hypothetical protein [Caudoviricetes sp.]